jgi:glutamate-ammonia-ligase adenylyltransferase
MSGPELLTRIAEASDAVARILRRHHDLLPSISLELPERAGLLAEAHAEVTEALAHDDPEAAVRRGLRRLKYRVIAGLILRDLEDGPDGVELITESVSDLADALTDAAIRFAHVRTARRHPRPESWPDPGGFVAIAMGKHGARELNYSSDIDLIWVIADHQGADYGNRIGGLVVGVLADHTEDGFCFRVDLALRPDGRAGPPTTALAAAEQYYLTYGRTWERAAWLKARPCAGDLALGEELLRRIAPFRFRRSMDFGTLEDLGAMRDRIADAARLGDLAADLKRGPGGIREVEFLVQAQQLVWAGRDPELRVAGTLEALRRLEARSVLPDHVDAEGLADAYRFLRAVEHRLQWAQEAQTQRLPAADDGAAWARLARLMKFAGDVDGFRAELAEHRALIERSWAGLLSGTESISTSFPALVDPFAEPAERRRDLASLGFADPAAAEKLLDQLARASARERMRPEAWRRFERVAPRLLLLAADSADPDAALARLRTFIARVGARGTTYSLLAENPRVMRTLIRLFAESGYLSELLCAHPELLDALLLRGRGGAPGAEALRKRLQEQLDAREDPDDAMLAMRTFHTAELLRIGLADLTRDPEDETLPCGPLTDLARACVHGAMEVATRRMLPRHGMLPAADGAARDLAVLGLGSLGSGWVTYGSDVDLVFLYADDAEDRASTGPRSLDPVTWTARWSQRVITALSAPTREGRCYAVDMRLRPDGSGGALVVPISGFAAYLRDRAKPWERIALCRASIAAASTPEVADAVAAALVQAHTSRPADPGEIVREVRRMRRRQRDELAGEGDGRLHLKTGLGGLTEVEFAVACVQTTRRPGHPAAGIADPLEALDVLTQTGDIAPQAAADLALGYRLLRRVEARLRLRSGRSANVLRFPSDEADRVAAALAMGPAAKLKATIDTHRDAIAAAAAQVLSRVEAASG